MRLGDIGTHHVWFASIGAPTGCDLISDGGEPVVLPDDDWWDLEGTIDETGRWQWDGEGNPVDFNRNTVQSISAFPGGKHHCGCGLWTGVSCEWNGPESDMVVVEYMPKDLRASHVAARNKGEWPHNGAVRVAVERCCGELVAEEDGEWARIVEGVRPADYLER